MRTAQPSSGRVVIVLKATSPHHSLGTVLCLPRGLRQLAGGGGVGHHASRMRTAGVDGPASSGPSRGALGSGLHGPCPPPHPGRPRGSTQLQRTGSPRRTPPVSVREVCSISALVFGLQSTVRAIERLTAVLLFLICTNTISKRRVRGARLALSVERWTLALRGV